MLFSTAAVEIEEDFDDVEPDILDGFLMPPKNTKHSII